MDKPKLLSLEMHLMHMYALEFGELVHPTDEPDPVESCIEVKLRVTGGLHSIFKLYGEMQEVEGADVIERLASALGNSSSAPSDAEIKRDSLEISDRWYPRA